MFHRRSLLAVRRSVLIPTAPPAGNGRWSSSDKHNVTLSNDDFSMDVSTSAAGAVRSVASVTAGSFYFEFTVDSTFGFSGCGLANTEFDLTNTDMFSNQSGKAYWFSIPFNYLVGHGGAFPALSAGQVAGIAFTLGGGIWARNTGTPSVWNDGGGDDPATNTGGYDISALTGVIHAMARGNSTADGVTLNLTGPFSASAPSGFSPFVS
jgi:hypothetical protein